MSKLERPETVFVICEAGSDINALIDVFDSCGLQTLNVIDTMIPNASISDTTRRLIEDSDFVCAVLKEGDSPNVYYEVGYARGLKRPLVIISESSMLPDDLSDQFIVKSSLEDVQAVRFQIQAFLANFDPQRARRAKRTKPKKSRLARAEKLMGRGMPVSVLERGLLDSLLNSPEINAIAAQPDVMRERGYVPDFAVWLSNGSKLIQSPVVIEVKGGNPSDAAIEQIVSQMRSFTEAGDVPTGIIIIDDNLANMPRVVNLAPLIFILDLKEFRRLIDTEQLVDVLRRERNRYAHSAG